MTKEENIATLNENLDHWKRLLSEKICDQSEGEKTIDALQNAIKALEQEPCDDCVNRQAVLDVLDKSKYSNEFCAEHHIDWSINLGMAHIVVNELKPVTLQPCGDAISRQAVLEVIRKCHCEEWVKADIGAPIETLQSVTPQPKMGRWIKCIDDNGSSYYLCNVCRCGEDFKFDWCPNCGANMSEIPTGAEGSEE